MIEDLSNALGVTDLVQTETSSDGPYLREVYQVTVLKWNKDFDQDAKCNCGHAYYRHFDTWEDMAAIGCKYCGCRTWRHPSKKAGLIPSIVEDGVIKMGFMISSDPAYGGAKPQISKGNVDPGETVPEAAEREALEELGLEESNFDSRLEPAGEPITVTGMDDTYDLQLFIVRIKSREALVKPHYETKEVVWLTIDEFVKQGRESHIPLVQMAHEKIIQLL